MDGDREGPYGRIEVSTVMQRVLPAALTIGAVLWTLIILTAPRALRSETWGPVAAHVYAGAGRICHQRPERTFHVAGVQMPVCARCAGLYISGALASLVAWVALWRSRPSKNRAVLLIAALPTAVTWSLEMLGLASFSNAARAVAAVPLGAAAGWVFVQMLRYDAHLDARQDHHSRPRPHGI